MTFDHLVGQEKIKRKLNYYLQSKSLPFLCFNGEKGAGKTEFAKSFLRQLKNKDGEQKKGISFNCSSIKDLDSFFDSIYLPFIFENEVSVLLDECHTLPDKVVNAFLTIFEVKDTPISKYRHKDNEYIFDFEKQTFVFATTELDRLFPPFKDRLTILELEPYNNDEIGGIINKVCPNINIPENILKEFSNHTRGNARDAVKLAKEFRSFCESKNIKNVNEENFREFIFVLDINPLGISNIEKNILKLLEKNENSLQELSSKTGMSRSAIQKESEVYLLRRGLMTINGKRQITPKGRQIVKLLS